MAAPVYRDEVDQSGYQRRRRSGAEPRHLHEGRRHHRHRRPENPSSSADDDDDDNDDESWDVAPPKRRPVASESDTESDYEALPQRGRRERHERYIESSEDSDVHGGNVRTPSTSSREPIDDHMPSAPESVAPRRYSVKKIEPIPEPRLVRPTVSSEAVNPRSGQSSRRCVFVGNQGKNAV